MKATHFILAIIFLLFAFVQVNDPDPIVWILIYGNMAVLCILAMFRIYNKVWHAISAAVYVIYSFTLAGGARQWWQSPDRSLLFDDLAKMQNIYIEETREFLGLMICLAVLAFQFLASKR
jgi:hypothetical protein